MQSPCIVPGLLRNFTRDPGSQFLYLRDVRNGSVWSATYHPTDREPEEYLVTFHTERAEMCLKSARR